jgi:hypothetical protein
MIVAIVVSVLAVCAILYGLLCNRSEDEPMPFPEIENVESAFDQEMEIAPEIENPQN